MAPITRSKLEQAAALVAAHDLDCWLTFVRETAGGSDPVLPLILEGGLTWQSALMVFRSGRKVAVVGNYDADPLAASGDWDEVVPYVTGIAEPLLQVLERNVARERPGRVGVNVSTNDVKADGLTLGMFRLLERYLDGSRFRPVEAESLLIALRGRKTNEELARIRVAIAETQRLFEEIGNFASVGRTEREVYDHVRSRMADRGFGSAWDPVGDPIVNSGPDSMVGHGVPSPTLRLAPGHVFHVDLGIVVNGYASDLQRCWFVAGETEPTPPEDVTGACAAVVRAIDAAASALRPGVPGWEVDRAARDSIVGSGYDEYMHAVGHQVGRMAHDGGGILGPRWERYGATPLMPVEQGQVYTLELGVTVPNRGYFGFEEMVVVRAGGCEFLSDRQTGVWLLDAEKRVPPAVE
ncbi:MAG: aminopeptidase P family protein [Fimbriimonadaceae bacterium]|nr:aminopeptidase P family protein [Fimbriimonadaceae bacterium]